MNIQDPTDTICAISSPQGLGAISLIRLSGSNALEIIDTIFSRDIQDMKSHEARFGSILNQEEVLDEVLITIFKNPQSFTGEDLVEIGCHGSVYIQQIILNLLIDKGARLAAAGEFSLRAFLNGKMDLSQTEAIADLIASSSSSAHKVAMSQMRGGYSTEISELRQELMNFAALIELELDFSEEDVEFADRKKLIALIDEIKSRTRSLVNSFKYGNVIKNGVPVAIVGAPNAGKSTLLNLLLNDDKAIVSHIAGTTRDAIEDTVVFEGIEFRFIDTAGIRDTTDILESEGIRKSYEKIKAARIILLLFDLAGEKEEEIIKQISLFEKRSVAKDQKLICVFNKSDIVKAADTVNLKDVGLIMSAKSGKEIGELKKILIDQVRQDGQGYENIVTNVRHHDILRKSLASIAKVEEGLQSQLTGDLLAMDIRDSLNLMGEITGEITSDDLLGNIFANFCIGK
jgi:tRNA modification GTPase